MPTRLLVGVAAVAAVVGALVSGLVVWATEDDTPAAVTVTEPAAPAPVTPASPPASSPAAFDPRELYRQRSAGVVTIYAVFPGSRSQGSGFVVDRDGTILTNAHVITDVGAALAGSAEGADRVYVVFQDGERVAARIVGWDLFNDVGVVDVDPADHPVSPVPLGDSQAVAVGEPVAAIGSPFDNQSSLSAGVVSATGRSIESLTSAYRIADAIQTDTPINKGNSGGPLFDSSGRVIGINAQIRTESGLSEGVGFAVPIDTARRAMKQLLATGQVRYAYLGVTTEDVTPGIAERFGLPARRGALVVEVEPGAPAAKAGLRPGDRTVSHFGLSLVLGGDLIVKIGDRAVHSAADISRAVTEDLAPGDKVKLTLYRGSEKRDLQVTVGTRPPSQ